jgi:LacI family transcriptional regulator
MSEGSVRRFRVALLMELGLGYPAKVVRGIARYVQHRHDWVFRWVHAGARCAREVSRWRADAVIGGLSDARVARDIARLGLPTVNVALEQPRMPFVHISNDDFAIGSLAGHYFQERGLLHVAYAHGSDDAGDRRRELGLVRAARAAACSSSTLRPRGLRHLGAWLEALPKPVGVLAYNDGVAVRVLEACNLAGIAVPDSVAVLGVDDAEALCLTCDPPLSSIVVAAERIGFEAARVLEDALRSGRRRKLRLFVPPLGVTTRQSTDVFAVDDAVVVRALRTIAERAHEAPSVLYVARACHVDRRALERRFRAVLSRSPFDEIRRVQIRRAKEMLTGTDLPLWRVAEHAGFSSAKHLSVAFSRVEGVAPSALRRRSRGRLAPPDKV